VIKVKIATWNVNSLRVRLPHVLKWLEEEKPDILALQELKMETLKFPEENFKLLGYYTVANGQKTYNGVAIISKLPLTEIEMPDHDEQHRMLSVTVNNMRIINAYVPNGEAVDSPKYIYKLNWFECFKKYIAEQLHRYPRLIILGDFNIAPADEDVHDPKAWEGQVLCSAPERQVLNDIIQMGFADSFRLFPQAIKSFSWWDYRMIAFRRNMGLRIDHILISHALKSLCQGCWIDKNPRKWEQPSDHAPVIADFKSDAY
jgi:exodeoxyribonuclease-3